MINYTKLFKIKLRKFKNDQKSSRFRSKNLNPMNFLTNFSDFESIVGIRMKVIKSHQSDLAEKSDNFQEIRHKKLLWDNWHS